MACIINIETATEVCSVAISIGGQIVFSRCETNGPSHATLLGVFADEAIKYLRTEGLKADAVAVSCGPGSYTGLRIGVSEAKGLCFGLDVPLIAIETLKIMAWTVASSNKTDEKTLLCPMIDARRLEVYDTIYNKEMKQIRTTAADIINEHSFDEWLEKGKVAFFGNGAAKCKDILKHDNALFLETIFPLADNMSQLAEAAFSKQEFADIAYFEPFYLKEFVATTPKNKVLGNLNK